MSFSPSALERPAAVVPQLVDGDRRQCEHRRDTRDRSAVRESRVAYPSHSLDKFLAEATDSINRAIALTDPESDWWKVVLADDWIYPECLERMLAVANEHERVGVVSSYQRWGDRVHLTHLPYDKEIIEGPAVLVRTFLYDENVTGNPTAVMFRTGIVRELEPFYDRRLNHADTDAAYRTLVDHDLGFVHQVLSFARRQGGTNIDRSDRIGSAIAENLLSVVRYGPNVMDAEGLPAGASHARRALLAIPCEAVRAALTPPRCRVHLLSRSCTQDPPRGRARRPLGTRCPHAVRPAARLRLTRHAS